MRNSRRGEIFFFFNKSVAYLVFFRNFKFVVRDRESWADFYTTCDSETLILNPTEVFPVRSQTEGFRNTRKPCPTSPASQLSEIEIPTVTQDFLPPKRRQPDVTLELTYKAEAASNTAKPFPTDHESRRDWTRRERQIVSQAKEPLTWESLREEVGSTHSFPILEANLPPAECTVRL